ncbi:hypothetical protein QBC44DRAFT_248280, partial [Cladorrhinum sp. PSN332]
ALKGMEEVFKPDYISTVNTVKNLNNLYRDLKGYGKALLPDHMSTLNTINNLSILYKN